MYIVLATVLSCLKTQHLHSGADITPFHDNGAPETKSLKSTNQAFLCVQIKRLFVQTKRLCSQTKYLFVQTKRLCSQTKHLFVQTRRLCAQTKRLFVQTKRLCAQTMRLCLLTTLRVSVYKSSGSVHKPSVSVRKPSVSVCKPSVSVYKPSVSVYFQKLYQRPADNPAQVYRSQLASSLRAFQHRPWTPLNHAELETNYIRCRPVTPVSGQHNERFDMLFLLCSLSVLFILEIIFHCDLLGKSPIQKSGRSRCIVS